ncbi:MAG: nucleoside hydrolase [Candidatus Woesearchaeota archaeon]
MKEKILIDTDLGSDVDDALALLFALKSPRLSLEGITTVYGKTDLRAKIAKKMVDYADADIPVYAGAGNPLTPNTFIWHTGREGEGILAPEEYLKPLAGMEIGADAADFLIKKVMSAPHQYNLVTIGGLTNIAQMLLKEPRTEGKIKHIYMMGGAISFPEELDLEKIIPASEPEHNIRCDIEAARIVFNSKTPKTLLPIDTTAKVPIDREDFEYLHGKGPCEDAVKKMVDVWFDYRDGHFGRRVGYTCMHDPLTVAAVVYPSLLKQKEMPLIVDSQGLTQISEQGKPVNLCYDVDRYKFRRIFLETILA